jgi:hypothetical protein
MTDAGVYTVEEKAVVTNAVIMTGMAVAIADMGIVSSALEMAALAKEMVTAAETYPHNNIVQAIFSSSALRENSLHNSPKDITPDNAIEKAIAAINAAMNLLAPKASPKDVEEFRAFVYRCAKVVANAAGSGLLGSGSPKVSAPEETVLAQLKVALGQ